MMLTDMRSLMPLGGVVPGTQWAQSGMLPFSMAAKQRNTVLDWLFYDVGSLTTSEFLELVREINLEGSILVVHPRGPGDERRVQKFSDYSALRAAPGRLLQRFTIAGVGSSDVGAAAFARTVADHYGEPVGAIVAGYGVADVLAEALGGWFVLGMGNQIVKRFHDYEAATSDALGRFDTSTRTLDREHSGEVAERVTGSPDSDTLLRLLLDEDRTIKSVIGHSKGCLSMAHALQALAVGGTKAALAKAKKIKCITTGAVVEFPNGFSHVAQFLGELDGFGRLNSREGVAYEPVAHAWHHMNTSIPFHMDMHEVLDRADRP